MNAFEAPSTSLRWHMHRIVSPFVSVDGVGRLASVSVEGDAKFRGISPKLNLWPCRVPVAGPDRFCRSSTIFRSSLVASPSLSATSSSTVSASLSSLGDTAIGPPSSIAAIARDAPSLWVCFALFLVLPKMDPTGFLGSGRAKEAFLLGMMMGSSSVASDSESTSLRPESCDTLRRWMLPGLDSSMSTVVSARARPFESMVNFTDVRVRGPPDSGIEVKLDRR